MGVMLRHGATDVISGSRDSFRTLSYHLCLTKHKSCFQPQVLCAREILEADFDIREKHFYVLKQNTLHYFYDFMLVYSSAEMKCPAFKGSFRKQEAYNIKQLFIHLFIFILNKQMLLDQEIDKLKSLKDLRSLCLRKQKDTFLPVFRTSFRMIRFSKSEILKA